MIPVLLASIRPEVLLFGGAALISLIAFVSLIVVPAVGSFGRFWEKAAAGFLSIFVLISLVAIGLVIGILIVRYYNDIVNAV